MQKRKMSFTDCVTSRLPSSLLSQRITLSVVASSEKLNSCSFKATMLCMQTVESGVRTREHLHPVLYLQKGTTHPCQWFHSSDLHDQRSPVEILIGMQPPTPDQTLLQIHMLLSQALTQDCTRSTGSGTGKNYNYCYCCCHPVVDSFRTD